MHNKITKPKRCLVENDEFFYRHPEMYRARLDDESNDSKDLNNVEVENTNKDRK